MNHEALGLPGKCYIDFLPKSRRAKRNVPPVLPKRVTSPKGYKNLRDQPLETWPSDPFIMDLSYVASFSPDYKEQTTNLPDQPLNLQTSMSWLWSRRLLQPSLSLSLSFKKFPIQYDLSYLFSERKVCFLWWKKKTPHPAANSRNALQRKVFYCREI